MLSQKSQDTERMHNYGLQIHKFDRYYPYCEASEKLIKFHLKLPEIIANKNQIFSGMNT